MARGVCWRADRPVPWRWPPPISTRTGWPIVSGYADGGGGIITLHRGNVDSLFPQHTRGGTGARRPTSDSPFVATARAFAAPAAPDFLAAGDFDADGHSDVLAAAQGGEAVLLRGDGRGRLRAAHHIDLPGAVTAMAVGEINGRLAARRNLPTSAC